MQHNIDVIFTHPKDKFFVILHKGCWWQLPRMHISLLAWQHKKPYLGSLEQIYLNQEQQLQDPALSTILHLETALPKQVIGISAARFVSWWRVHAYDFLQNKMLSQLSIIQDKRKTPTAKNNDAIVKKQTDSEQGQIINQHAIDSSVDNKTIMDNKASKDNNVDTDLNAQNALKEPVAKEDIFDSLLHELNEEVLHPNL